eukprot:7377502-Prymnesium_polylepis.2
MLHRRPLRQRHGELRRGGGRWCRRYLRKRGRVSFDAGCARGHRTTNLPRHERRLKHVMRGDDQEAGAHHHDRQAGGAPDGRPIARRRHNGQGEWRSAARLAIV